MPWQLAEPQPAPVPPAPLVQPGAAPRIPLAPEGHADRGRTWARDGADMTPELQRNTQPYLQAVMRMGADFKKAHADGTNPEKTVAMIEKLMKRYEADNPLPANATEAQRAAHTEDAATMLQNFHDNLPMQGEVHEATRELRHEFKNATAGNYTPAMQQVFEARYAELRERTGRQELSPLEQALPVDSPLRTKLDPLTGGLRDPSTGLYANMVEMGEDAAQKNVLIFGGTGVGGALSAQVQADAGQFLGGVPKAYQQAAELTRLVGQGLENQGNTNALETAGHSLGGGLAHYAALKNGGIQATCFNAAALGGGCKASLGDNIHEAKNNVRHINVDGDGVGDGIGMLRRPVQKAADTVQGGVNGIKDRVNLAATNAQAIAQGAADQVAEATQPLRTAVQPALDSMRNAGNTVAGAARGAGNAVVGAAREAGGAVVGAANDAKQAVGGAATAVAQAAANTQVGQGVAQAAQSVAQSTAGRAVGNAVAATKATAQAAGQQVAEGAATAKASVRDALRGIKGRVSEGVASLKQGAKDLAKEAADGIKQTGVGQKAASAHESAVKLHENLGFSQGKLAIPHQYGGCITLANGGEMDPGKNNPIKNHMTGALAKAYERNAQQNVAVRNQITLGQQRGGGGHGHGV